MVHDREMAGEGAVANVEQQTQYQAGRPKQEKLIEIRMTKATLYLTEAELSRLLARDPGLWREAVKRGKAIARVEKAGRRFLKLPEERGE